MTIDLCGIDNGLENPQFAAIEIDYSEAGLMPKGQQYKEKQFVIYEVDLGLNHVVPKHVEKVPDSAHHIISLPGESFEDDQGLRGPGGVLVVCDDQIIFKKP